MSAQKKDVALSEHLARERTLYVYSRALDEADFETMARIQAQCETDPVLERMIAELEDAEFAAIPELALAPDAELVRGLLKRHLPAASGPAAEPTPLTVAEVAGKLLADRTVAPQDRAALHQLQGRSETVPAQLGLSDVRRLAGTLGVQASERLLRLFRDAALLLGLSQSQEAGFAAARRQDPQPPADAPADEPPAEAAIPAKKGDLQ